MLKTLPEVAQKLRLTRVRVWQLVQSGSLPAEKIGRDWFVKEDDLKNFKRLPAGRPKSI